jgi:phospholipid/cholesterol/gamma-HCH transport system substrate-binding protein
MKNSIETKLGIFVVLAVFAAVFIVEILGGTEMFTAGKHVVAEFNTAQDLKVGDSVKMAGVEIGRVEKIGLDVTNSKVTIIMKLRKDAMVKTDSTAIIKFTGLMGQNYVGVSFGTPSAPLASDSTVLQTQEQPDLSAIMAKLDNAASGIATVANSFSGDRIDNILGPLTDFMKQNSAPLTATISNIKNVSSQIAAGQGTVGKLIYEDSLYTTAMGTVSNLQDTITSAHAMIDSTHAIVDGISAGKGTIGKLMTDDALYTSTASSMTNLNQILIKINQGNGTVGKLVNDQEFYKNAKLSLQKLDKAADGLEDTGPLSVIGTMMSNLF